MTSADWTIVSIFAPLALTGLGVLLRFTWIMGGLSEVLSSLSETLAKMDDKVDDHEHRLSTLEGEHNALHCKGKT